jgi:hypothetical protein
VRKHQKVKKRANSKVQEMMTLQEQCRYPFPPNASWCGCCQGLEPQPSKSEPQPFKSKVGLPLNVNSDAAIVSLLQVQSLLNAVAPASWQRAGQAGRQATRMF